uniref:Uncharacterized protein n=1 Tax=Opuntia streptacantha TaxID=393608 RepID=A0A7C9AQ32_OPUST
MHAPNFGTRDPSKQSHELAPITNPETKSIRSAVEFLKLIQNRLIEPYRSRPTLCRIEDISIAKAPNKCNPSELFQGDGSIEKVRHCYIPRLKTSSMECCRHFSVPVATFLPQYSYLRLSSSKHVLIMCERRSKGQ